MYSQVRNKNLFAEKGSKVNASTLIHLLNSFYSKEAGASPERMKKLGEQIGPRIYESMQYFKDNNPKRRALQPEEVCKFLCSSVGVV